MATQPTYCTGTNGTRPAWRASEGELRIARRLDWRFLLSNPASSRVGYCGGDHRLRDTLRHFTPSFVEIHGNASVRSGEAGHGTLDLAVLSNPSEADLCRAVNWMSARGDLYIELNRRGHLQSISRIEKQLRELGLRSVRRIWNRPRFEGCRELMPLSENLPMRYLLARSRGDYVAQVKAQLARLVHSSGALPLAAPCVSLVASRNHDSHGELPAWLANNWTRLGCDTGHDVAELSFLLLCPQFATSRHVVLLVFDRDSDTPLLAIKVARLAGDNTALCDEYETLVRVHSLRAGGFDSIPKVQGFDSVGERAILVESGLGGELMRPRTVRKEWLRCARPVLEWLCEFNSASRDAAKELHSLSQCAEATAARLCRSLAPSGEEQAVIADCIALASTVTATVPRTWQHADLGHPNLLLASNGTVRVIDWELATPNGLPACDLFFFLTYVAFARALADTNDDSLLAFRDAFFVPRAWARPIVREYAERMGVPREALTPLFLLCWMEYLAARTERMSSDSEDVAAITWIRQDRYYHLWRYAAEHVQQLDWQS